MILWHSNILRYSIFSVSYTENQTKILLNLKCTRVIVRGFRFWVKVTSGSWFLIRTDKHLDQRSIWKPQMAPLSCLCQRWSKRDTKLANLDTPSTYTWNMLHPSYILTWRGQVSSLCARETQVTILGNALCNPYWILGSFCSVICFLPSCLQNMIKDTCDSWDIQYWSCRSLSRVVSSWYTETHVTFCSNNRITNNKVHSQNKIRIDFWMDYISDILCYLVMTAYYLH